MDKKEQLKGEIWQIVKIYITAKENFLYSRYLFQPETEEERIYIMTNLHLKVIRTYLWRLCIIETAKLVSETKGERFRLTRFIRGLKADGHYGDLGIEKGKIDKWESILKDNKSLIDNIKTLRDKVYAHSEKDEAELKIAISFPQIENILSLTGEIIREIYSTAFESTFILDAPSFMSGNFNIVKILAAERERTIKPMVDLAREIEGKSAF